MNEFLRSSHSLFTVATWRANSVDLFIFERTSKAPPVSFSNDKRISAWWWCCSVFHAILDLHFIHYTSLESNQKKKKKGRREERDGSQMPLSTTLSLSWGRLRSALFSVYSTCASHEVYKSPSLITSNNISAVPVHTNFFCEILEGKWYDVRDCFTAWKKRSEIKSHFAAYKISSCPVC